MLFSFSVGMFFTAVCQTLVLHQYFHRCFMTGMRVRAALVTAIYRKTLVLSNAARQQSTVGEVNIFDLCDKCTRLTIFRSSTI